jgi:L-alanine-DL-glutamate epimerase-like enolase superfamily enzyme
VRTQIEALEASRLDVPLRRAFGIAGGTQEVARNVLVSLTLADGTRGYGEAAPFPAFNGETQEATLAAIGAANAVVLGADVRRWRSLAIEISRCIGAYGAARCGIEMAILDALTRQAGMSLQAFFGGAGLALVTDVTIPTGSSEEAAHEARGWAEQGFSRLKIKVGGSPLGEDLDRIEAVHRAAPRAALLLDGNGGFPSSDAVRLVRQLEARGITPLLFEQPVARDDWEGLAEVGRATGLPIVADESASSAKDALRVAQTRVAQIVNVKPMKAGFVEAMDIAAIARAAGLRLMIGGMVEAKMAMTASACFAAGLGGFDFVDLDTPLFLSHDPFDGGYVQEGERLDLTPVATGSAGHGVTPKRDR